MYFTTNSNFFLKKGEKNLMSLLSLMCLLSLLPPPSFYTRSTFAGTELDFRLKLTKQTKNNPPQEREREGVKDRDGRKEGGRVLKRYRRKNGGWRRGGIKGRIQSKCVDAVRMMLR